MSGCTEPLTVFDLLYEKDHTLWIILEGLQATGWLKRFDNCTIIEIEIPFRRTPQPFHLGQPIIERILPGLIRRMRKLAPVFNASYSRSYKLLWPSENPELVQLRFCYYPAKQVSLGLGYDDLFIHELALNFPEMFEELDLNGKSKILVKSFLRNHPVVQALQNKGVIDKNLYPKKDWDKVVRAIRKLRGVECPICGKLFYPKSQKGKVCSNACRVRKRKLFVLMRRWQTQNPGSSEDQFLHELNMHLKREEGLGRLKKRIAFPENLVKEYFSTLRREGPSM